MQNEVLRINKFATRENSVESFVSFKKFADFLQNKINTDKRLRVRFFQFVLDKIRSHPELITGVPVNEVGKYADVLELVASVVFPLIEDEENMMFGLTNGISAEVFYASNAFHRLHKNRPDIGEGNEQTWIGPDNALQLHQQTQYDLVLQKVYGLELPQKTEMLRSFFNPVTGLYQYFRLHVDTRFVDVTMKEKTANGKTVNGNAVMQCFECHCGFEEIEKLVPLNNFTASGFSIVTLTDITEQQAIEQLSKAIVSIDKEKKSGDFIHITRLLQTMLGSSTYKFGIMPFFTVNKRAALLYENFPYSLLVKASWDAGIPKPVFTRYINHFIKEPKVITYRSTDKTNVLPKPLQEALKKAGMHYYVLVPVYFNDTLVGILETGAAAEAAPLTERHFAKLKPAISYISQLLKKMIDKFNIAIDGIVKEKFTVIQPSVQWKFNEVAWHYFRSHDIEHKNSALEKISFKNVYPLYGAIDIRNSTIERNKSLREDLQVQLDLLVTLLQYLQDNGQQEANALIAECRSWLSRMVSYVSVEEELQFNDFLFSRINPFLSSFENADEAIRQKLGDYFDAIDESNGIVFLNRRQLENSIRLLNKSIGKYFDVFKDDLELYYPCYFEKFRTDGIEYDIYIGQSIAPKTPFTLRDVEKLRLWQVESMANITRITHNLLPQLEHPLLTTQLIFVNGRTIDISFRNDERRFDVEGAYNIRYHIIKKRIDKVNILNTTERLTQPGKIAIVYFNERDANEYIGYINQLQQKQILLDDLEHLDLEELQGVAGLRALRVGVNLDTVTGN